MDNKTKNQKKAIVMFSGGLDSRLVLKIMQEQDFDILALFFKLPFVKYDEKELKEFITKEKVKLKIFDCTKGELLQEYLKIIKKAEHGVGKGINPCIDCRIFMLKKAKEFANKKNIKIIATGEVLGQRPMSQHKRGLDIVEKESGLKGRLFRPLIGEGIHGRRRIKQIALAEKFKISYPSPAGGCLLCEKLYCEKLKKILDKEDLDYNDIKLLKIGRHFEASQIILGRNKKENEFLEEEKGIKIIPQQIGPTALIKSKKYEKKAKELIKNYSNHKIKDFIIKKNV